MLSVNILEMNWQIFLEKLFLGYGAIPDRYGKGTFLKKVKKECGMKKID